MQTALYGKIKERKGELLIRTHKMFFTFQL